MNPDRPSAFGRDKTSSLEPDSRTGSRAATRGEAGWERQTAGQNPGNQQ